MIGPDEDAHDGESVRLPAWRCSGSTAGAGAGSEPCWTAGASRCSTWPTSPPSSPCRTSRSSPSTCRSGCRRTASAPATSRPGACSAGAASSVFPAPLRPVLGARRLRGRVPAIPIEAVGEGAVGAGLEPGAGHPLAGRRPGRPARSTASSRCTPSWRSARWTRGVRDPKGTARGLAQRMTRARRGDGRATRSRGPAAASRPSTRSTPAPRPGRRSASPTGTAECVGDGARDSRGRPMRICY